MAVGKTVGYIRVSTEEQNPERQLEGLQRFPLALKVKKC